MSFINKLWKYLKNRKKFWLLPVFIMILLLVGLILLNQELSVIPIIYTLN